jgi:drug/metabolite transporter (DMT)-like permease
MQLVFEKCFDLVAICYSSVIFAPSMKEKRKIWHWLVLGVLSLIWGTSYILMKEGLKSFSPLQVGSLRIVITFLCLLPVSIHNFHRLNRGNILSIALIGFLGSAIPAFLFPMSETKISSSLAGMLNSLSPVFTLIIGVVLYYRKPVKTQIAGVFLGLLGAAGLLYTGSFTFSAGGLLVVLATFLSGFSSNEVSKVKEMTGLQITSLSFLVISPVAIIYLFSSNLPAAANTIHWTRNLGCIAILAVMGSAISNALYYRLIRDSSPVFASTVTYFIPIVATMWGIADDEHFTSSMVVSILVIFAGVYIINRPNFFKGKEVKIPDE